MEMEKPSITEEIVSLPTGLGRYECSYDEFGRVSQSTYDIISLKLTFLIPLYILWYMNNDSTTLLSIKTKKQVKELAQMRAKQLGFPLGTLVNAFLRNLGQTGDVHFTIDEPITPKMAELIEKMRTEVLNGDTYGPFETINEAENFLDSIPGGHKN